VTLATVDETGDERSQSHAAGPGLEGRLARLALYRMDREDEEVPDSDNPGITVTVGQGVAGSVGGHWKGQVPNRRGLRPSRHQSKSVLQRTGDGAGRRSMSTSAADDFVPARPTSPSS